MNSEKHKKDLLQQWLRGEEIFESTSQRNPHLLSAYVKIHRPFVWRPPEPPVRVLSAKSIRLDHSHSQRPSSDHLQKLNHVGRMRASFEYMTIQHPPVKSFPQKKAVPVSPAYRKSSWAAKRTAGVAQR